MKKAIYYHAGCPVCEGAMEIVEGLDPSRFDIEIVDLSRDRDRIAEAEAFGIESVPCLVIDARPFHINFGEGLEQVKNPGSSTEGSRRAYVPEEGDYY